MALEDPAKLEKLKIKAYRDRERQHPVSPTFQARFNPASFSHTLEVKYGGRLGVGTSATEARFMLSKPQHLDLELLFDETGFESSSLPATSGRTVREQVESFLESAYKLNGSTHEPNFLVLERGELSFPCRLKKATVTYLDFDRGGNPLRAKLAVTMVSDASAETTAAADNRTSPDLTHTRTVKAGDTLPLLTKQVYGSAQHYLFVAQANTLDDFRNLTIGQELVFPPLEGR